MLRGEAGIGKTRLADHFPRLGAARRGPRGLHSGAFESSSHQPFQPWVDLLRTELEREVALGPEGRPAEELSLLAQLLPEWRERYPDQPPARRPPGPKPASAKLNSSKR